MDAILDIAFPYRLKRSFGAASFALIFLVMIAEVELLVLIALGIVGHRFDLFVDLQPIILPCACVVALSAATVFWWRARTWTRQRVDMLNLWAGGGTAFGEHLKNKRPPQ
ncbi:MAG TPA: hypothetical protein VM052_03720 [Candidatus Limnocylindrales bacterium]|nr:hypothetical protein [Candidatus Limnocylindrales bacterium]